MKKQLFAVLAALSLTGTGVAQNTIQWTVLQNSLDPVVGGIQMHGSAVMQINGQRYMYAVGGNRSAAGGDSTNITYASLNLTPVTAGTWAHTTFTFPVDGNNLAVGSTYIERATLVYNGRLYIVGGSHNSSTEPAVNKIRVFEPAASGDILAESTALGFDGAAASVTPSLGTAGSSAAVDPATGYLYVVGGSADTTVRRFKIDQSTGAVSDYQVLSTPLLHPAYFSSGMIIKGGYLYIIDSHNTADRGKIQFAPINGDGTLGAFALTTPLPAPHIDGGSAVVNGEIYVAGGHTGGGNSAVTNTVHRSVTGTSGQITSWVADASIPNADLASPEGLRRIGLASMGNDGFLIIGGRNNTAFPPHVFVAQPLASNVNDWTLY